MTSKAVHKDRGERKGYAMHNFKPQVGKYNMVLYEVEWVADNMNAILVGTINKTKGKLSKSLTDGHFSLCKLTHF